MYLCFAMGAAMPRIIIGITGRSFAVTPLRAIFEALPREAHHVTFLYREGEPAETVFREELLALAARHDATLRFLEGHRGTPEMCVDPLAPEWLIRHAPHLPEADVLICGSRSFTECALRSLRALRIPDDHIHAERFGY